jgi:hypothetical protein
MNILIYHFHFSDPYWIIYEFAVFYYFLKFVLSRESLLYRHGSTHSHWPVGPEPSHLPRWQRPSQQSWLGEVRRRWSLEKATQALPGCVACDVRTVTSQGTIWWQCPLEKVTGTSSGELICGGALWSDVDSVLPVIKWWKRTLWICARSSQTWWCAGRR